TLEIEVDQFPNILPCLLLDRGRFPIQMISRQRDCSIVRALRRHQEPQIDGETLSSKCCLTLFHPLLWNLPSANVGVSLRNLNGHLHRSWHVECFCTCIDLCDRDDAGRRYGLSILVVVHSELVIRRPISDITDFVP